MRTDLWEMSIAEASPALKAGKISPVELTQSCLARIERWNPVLNAFLLVTVDEALTQARTMEVEIRRGKWRGPLHGIPIALKDLIDVTGLPTTAASAVRLNHIAERDAPVVSKLKEAGAILLGKLNLHEFAYGGSGMISHFGVVRNPRDTACITGGSSSGSAATVAAGLCLAALGTDTAGSIRLPASYCGVVGFKPTYGVCSTDGVVPLSWSHDHVGPITRTVQDATLVFQAIAQTTASTVGGGERTEFSEGREARLKIGIGRDFFFDALDPAVEQSVMKAIAVIERLEGRAQVVSLPLDHDRSVVSAEAYAFHQAYLPGHAAEYQPETLKRIRFGEAVSASTYIHKRRDLDAVRKNAAALFRDVDLVLTPTSPVLPATIEDLNAEPDQLRSRELVMLRNTRPFNVFGLPAISVPCGMSQSGLPVGLQIVGRPHQDAKVLALAAAYERETQWERRYKRL